jgi:ribulose-phosphate 3-epimerase
MVADPAGWIRKAPGPHMHLVHVETIRDFAEIEKAVRESGGFLGLAINPETPLEKLLPYAGKAKRVLIMTVHPGFSGQKYIAAMGEKIRKLRSLYPRLDIEVDGGVNLETVSHAYSCGANILAAASAIFSAPDTAAAIKALKERASGVPS